MTEITTADKLNPLWAKLQEYWLERLAHLRQGNDNKLSLEETAFLRGRIAEVKGLIQMDVTPPLDF